MLSESPVLIKNNDGSLSCTFKAKYAHIDVTPGYRGEAGYKLEAYLTCQSIRFQYFCIDDSNPNPSRTVSYDTKFGTFLGDDTTSGIIEGEHITFVTNDDNDNNELVGTVTLTPPNDCGSRRLQATKVEYHQVELILKEKRTHVAMDQHVDYHEFQDVEVQGS